MQYILEDRGAVAVLRFDGDLGGSDEAELKKLFVELRRQGKDSVAVDMTRVGFMDSTVIGVLVWGMKNLREVGGDYRLFGLTEPVAKLFAITRLDQAFRIFPTEDEAVASFG
jgi:anti-sigma B factor antagonist